MLSLGILHTIFFHRYFPCIRPTAFDVLDLTLPAIDDVELETLIDSRVNSLILQHLSLTSNSPNGGVRGRIAVKFFEKKRRKGGLWFGGLSGKGEEEICWEIWTVDVTIATPRTESGRCPLSKTFLPCLLLPNHAGLRIRGMELDSEGAGNDGY